jgi:hypothetical protein
MYTDLSIYISLCSISLNAPQKHQDKIHPLAASHGFSFGFLSEFIWNGTNDYS